MKRKSIFIFSLVILLLFSFLGTLYIDSHISTNKLNNYLDEIDSETRAPICYAYMSTVYYQNTIIDLKNVLKDIQYSTIHILCIVDETIYFVYEYSIDSSRHWCLASVKFGDEKYTILLDEIFDCHYTIDLTDDYSERTGYYFNEKIILTDFKKIWEYDLQNELLSSYKYADYIQAQTKISYQIESNQKVLFELDGNTFILDKEKFSDSNDIAKYIFSNFDKKIWSGKSALYSFFDSVQIVDNEIYLFCRVLSYRGATNALVFKINFEDSIYEYCFSYYTVDVIDEDELYVIPVV